MSAERQQPLLLKPQAGQALVEAFSEALALVIADEILAEIAAEEGAAESAGGDRVFALQTRRQAG